ncbi:MAG: DUF502 domain-containing protein [Planctomycetes bacterium]|nr:DUF502 domain-containing protein [Planctomycetota bacterium]
MGFIGRLCLKGLAAILPLGLTIYLLYWLGAKAESLLAPLLVRILPGGLYVPGMGVVAGLVAVFLVGALMTTYLANWFFAKGERIVARIPVVKTIYGALKDSMAVFGGGSKQRLSQVVLVRMGEGSAQILGFLTRDDVKEITGAEGTVAVYLPLAYQIGGITVLVPRAAIQPVAMSGEDALRFAVTAGMSGS